MKKIILLLTVMFITNWAMSQKLEPTATDALLNIFVSDVEKTPSEGDKILLTGKKTGKTYSGVTGADGKFSILVPKGDTYVVKYKGFGEDMEYTELEIPGVDGLVNFDFDITYELPKTYTLKNVYFDTGKSTIKAESNTALNQLAEVMLSKKKLKIEIGGHTDNVGSVESNQKLSQDRAEAVKTYLVKKGVDATRVVSKGYGSSKPIASNDTDEGKQKNRRTEVVILQ